jgi:hypothetical protein
MTIKRENFDLDIRIKVKLKLLKELDEVEENQEFYEEFLYPMGAISGLFGTGAMRYNVNQ